MVWSEVNYMLRSEWARLRVALFCIPKEAEAKLSISGRTIDGKVRKE